MSEKRKLQTEIEGREPIDLDAVSRLIGATDNFRAGAHSYVDDLEGHAIWLLEIDELPKDDREVLELSSNLVRSLFDQLANTFVEPYRETKPDLVEHGYRMLWAVMKATSKMGAAPQSSITRKILADAQDNAGSRMRSGRKPHDEYADNKLTEAVAKAMNEVKTRAAVSDSYVKGIEDAVRDYLRQSYQPFKRRDGSLIKSQMAGQVAQRSREKFDRLLNSAGGKTVSVDP